MVNVRLVELLAVQKYLLVYQSDAIAWNAHAPLHEGLPDVHRISENDDVAAPHVFVGQKMLGKMPGWSVSHFVHQQVISNQQRVLHRARRDHESLHQSGGAEEQQDNGHGPFGDEAARLIGFRRRWRRHSLHFCHGCRFLLFHRLLLYRKPDILWETEPWFERHPN